MIAAKKGEEYAKTILHVYKSLFCPAEISICMHKRMKKYYYYIIPTQHNHILYCSKHQASKLVGTLLQNFAQQQPTPAYLSASENIGWFCKYTMY